MQCPRCQFHNLPGLTTCGRCGGALQEDTAALATYPPRAADRMARRIEGARNYLHGDAALTRGHVLSLRGALRERWRAFSAGFTRGSAGAITDAPRPRKNALLASALGVLPGVGHLYCGEIVPGVWLLGGAGLVALTILWSLRTPLLGFLLFLLFVCSAFSFVDAFFCARTHSKLPPLPRSEWVARAFALLAVYSGGVALLMGVVPIVTVNHYRLEPLFPARSRFLVTRLYWHLERGDFVVYRSEREANVDRIIGAPGDRVEVDGRAVTVNGVRLPDGFIPNQEPMGRQEVHVPAGSYLLYAHEPGYWVFGPAQRAWRDSVQVLPRHDIIAKALAVYSPPERRRWL